MKKILLTIACVGFLTTNIFAQAIESETPVLPSTTTINPIVGMTFSILTAEPAGFQSEVEAGWHAGAMMRTGDKIFFQPALEISQIGLSLNSAGVDYMTDVTHLRIPVAAGVRLVGTGHPEPQSSIFNIDVHGGVAADILLAVNERNNMLSKSDFNTTLISAIAGMAVDYEYLTLGVDYSIGLSDAFSESSKLASKAKSNSFFVTLGGNFPF
jgi:hypothetical protein